MSSVSPSTGSSTSTDTDIVGGATAEIVDGLEKLGFSEDDATGMAADAAQFQAAGGDAALDASDDDSDDDDDEDEEGEVEEILAEMLGDDSGEDAADGL